MTPDPLRDRVMAALGTHYLVEDEIGRGGMSVVYRARDPRLNRLVALKVLPPDLAHDPAVRTRFAREAHTAAQLAHPHIVPIHDVGERDGVAYFVMAYVAGGHLGALLAHDPRPPLDETRRVLSEIADALDYAHTRGVIHRDIKPDNILLERDAGRALVTDFGIARAMEAGARLTGTGIAVGTPAYMSPEQAMGERQVDGRSDIYSLGVLGYQMVTGRLPFTAGNSMAVLMKHVSEPPRPITQLRAETPRALRVAIERALMKDPDERWPTAGALRDALRSGEVPAASWRPARRAAVPYVSPRRGTPSVTERRETRAEPGLEPPHLAALTPAQKADLRLWHGRTHLLDRIKAFRGYTVFTAGMWIAGCIGFVAGVAEIPPLVLAPAVPAWMSLKWWRRGTSLRASGAALRRVLLMPRARWVLPVRQRAPVDEQLLAGPHGAAVRRAAEDERIMLELFARLSKEDRAMLPDVAPTARALVERVAHLAQALHELDDVDDPRGEELRATFGQQMDNAALALRNLRLDLVRLRSSGMRSALADVSNATQQARALSRDIGAVLEAAAEVRNL